MTNHLNDLKIKARKERIKALKNCEVVEDKDLGCPLIKCPPKVCEGFFELKLKNQ